MNTHKTRPCGAARFASVTRDDRGLSTVEYVVLLVLIVAASVGLWVNLGKELRDKLTLVNTEFGRVTFEPGSGNSGTPSSGKPPASTPAANSPTSALVATPMTESAPAKGKEDR